MIDVTDTKEEAADKTERVVRMLAEKQLGGVLLNAQYNFSWLTCGGTNGVDLSREAGAGSLFVRSDGRRFVLANNIEMRRLLAEELNESEYEAVEFPWEDEKARPDFLGSIAQSLLGSGSKIGSDLPIGGDIEVVASEVARLRYSLTSTEKTRYRSLGRDAGEAIEEVMRRLEPGVSEQEIARRATHALSARGCASVVSLVAADNRIALFRHPVPGNRRWEKVIMVVACARRGGLIASLTRLACVGTQSPELRRRTEATARANAELFAATKPGASGSELFGVVARSYERSGFAGEERLHHQGGATGYRTRDWVAHLNSSDHVQADQAFAWNPSITGTKVEETCIVSERGVEVVTGTTSWPKVTVRVEESEYELPGVLEL